MITKKLLLTYYLSKKYMSCLDPFVMDSISSTGSAEEA